MLGNGGRVRITRQPTVDLLGAGAYICTRIRDVTHPQDNAPCYTLDTISLKHEYLGRDPAPSRGPPRTPLAHYETLIRSSPSWAQGLAVRRQPARRSYHLSMVHIRQLGREVGYADLLDSLPSHLTG